jgi:uncharacterized protein YbaP (TraB family)
MNAHLKFHLSFAATALSVVLATSCSMVSGPDAPLLEGHPSQEYRMSDKPRPGYVATGVWRVKSQSGNVVYLAGTSHSVEASEIPFPSTYYAAYSQSRDVFFKTDPKSFACKFTSLRGGISVGEFMLEHRSERYSPKGYSLSESLSPTTVKLLQAHYGSKYAEKNELSPLGLIEWHELVEKREVFEKSGVDDYFRLLARRDRKKIIALDNQTVVQCVRPALESMLDKLREDIAKKGADAAVRDSILKKNESNVYWRHGITDRDAEELSRLLKQEYILSQMLIPHRNHEWIKPITRAIEGKNPTAVFVGAAHLPGKDGLLAMLRKKGYKPEQMFGIDHPAVRSKKQ